MAQAAVKKENTAPAYNFARYATAEPVPRPPKTNVKLAPVTRQKIRRQTKQYIQVLFMVTIIAVLGAFVIATYAKVGEIRSEITRQGTQLTNEQATYQDLIFQLESKTNLNMVEQRALEMGLVPMDKNQVTYIRVMEENQIEVQQSPLAELWEFLINWITGLFAGG